MSTDATAVSQVLDPLTMNFLEDLSIPEHEGLAPEEYRQAVAAGKARAFSGSLTGPGPIGPGPIGPIVELFSLLERISVEQGWTPEQLGVSREELLELARKHAQMDEHGVTVGGRVGKALSVVRKAEERIAFYRERHQEEAPSGIEVWDRILDNQARIKKLLKISEEDWHSFSGQLRHAIESVETLAQVVGLSEKAVADVRRVTQNCQNYELRVTPYYASLILSGRTNDPVLLQAVPSGEMLGNTGLEIPPKEADHSPARLIDQLYPRVLTIKATNMDAMSCTYCLGLAHPGAKELIYSKEAYGEALEYIRARQGIRDVLIAGKDSLMLPNSMLQWLLAELDGIEHIRVKRLSTRIPVTTPQRIDSELLDILEASNERKPLRVVTQINTAQEITPVSKAAFQAISKRVFAIMNEAMLLKGINDSKVKMWKLCETIQEAYVRPYYVFNCNYHPRLQHLRVPLALGQEIIESMYGNLSGDAIPRYIATAGGKIPLHKTNLLGRKDGNVRMQKPWSEERIIYPDADPLEYARKDFAFTAYGDEDVSAAPPLR
jgi:lysine 2,3-aminomutase